MKLLWERMKLVVEPSGAVSLAAVIKNAELFSSTRTGIVLTGGNVDLSRLPF
jgi:threonine dehydratase